MQQQDLLKSLVEASIPRARVRLISSRDQQQKIVTKDCTTQQQQQQTCSSSQSAVSRSSNDTATAGVACTSASTVDDGARQCSISNSSSSAGVNCYSTFDIVLNVLSFESGCAQLLGRVCELSRTAASSVSSSGDVTTTTPAGSDCHVVSSLTPEKIDAML